MLMKMMGYMEIFMLLLVAYHMMTSRAKDIQSGDAHEMNLAMNVVVWLAYFCGRMEHLGRWKPSRHGMLFASFSFCRFEDGWDIFLGRALERQEPAKRVLLYDTKKRFIQPFDFESSELNLFPALVIL